VKTRNGKNVYIAAPIAALLLTAGCGTDPGPARPVDAKFSATVTGDGVPDGYVVSVDVFWRGDGKVDVSFTDVDGLLPGPKTLEGVALQDGNEVLNEGDIALQKGAKPHHVRLEGLLGPEEIDLELTDTPPGGTAAAIRLRGEARPFDDASELDGEYFVTFEHDASVCPGESFMPFGSRNMSVDVLYVDGGARMTIDGDLVTTLPIVDGKVSWTGEIRSLAYDYRFQASAEGTLAPDELELSLDVPTGAAGSGCVDRAVLTGGKRLPDATAIDGDYRADYTWKDECFDRSGRLSETLRIVDQDEGTYDFHDTLAWLQFKMTPGQPFEGDFIDFFGSGAVIHYEGIIDPPDLSYHATYTYPFSEPCDVILDVVAYKRYFFPPDAE